MKLAEEISKILLEIKAVTLSPKDPYTYASGIKSPIYCDNRLLMGYPQQRRKVRDAYIDLIEENKLKFDIVGGTATAGIPHSAWIADKLNLPMVYIRSRSKGYGKNICVEGKFDKGSHVLIIEDLVSTGGSSVWASETVRLEGGIASDCVAIFTYGLKKAKEAFRSAEVKLHTITNLEILLNVALEHGYISAKEMEMVLKWQNNPDRWEKNGI